jgi:hypothetical protein
MMYYALIHKGELMKKVNGTNDLERLLALSILVQRGALPKMTNFHDMTPNKLGNI